MVMIEYLSPFIRPGITTILNPGLRVESTTRCEFCSQEFSAFETNCCPMTPMATGPVDLNLSGSTKKKLICLVFPIKGPFKVFQTELDINMIC